MPPASPSFRAPVPVLLLAALATVFLSFAWQGHMGFSLWDEGFLWYGVQRVLQGEVPIRDFMAYDPGRYYWSAAILHVLGGNGIMDVRLAVALFQALGLFVGLILIASAHPGRGASRGAFLLIATATLMAWMFPRHKLFDISISVLLIGLLSFLAARPGPRRLFIAGVGIGLTAVFGRNHGVYGAVGSIALIAWLQIGRVDGQGFVRSALLWAAGVLVGFLPVLCMALWLPGFGQAFWDGIAFLFESKATNLPLPVPWPWTVDLSAGPAGDTLRRLLVGLFFVGSLVFGVLAMLCVTVRRFAGRPVPAVLAASAFLALPYAHYAFSRADVGHLAQGIFPPLVGCLVALAGARPWLRWPLAAALCAASLWVMSVQHPGWQCRAASCVPVEISGHMLQLDPLVAHDVALLRGLAERHAPQGKSVMVAPFWPGAYALLERKAPPWEIYALFPRPAAFEQQEIGRLQAAAPGFVLIVDIALDGRDELRFRNTHPLQQQYIVDHFDPLPDPPTPAYQIYIPKRAGP